MNVIINGLPLLKAKTGVGHYLADLTSALKNHFPSDRWQLFPPTVMAHFITELRRRLARRQPSRSAPITQPAKTKTPRLTQTIDASMRFHPWKERAKEWNKMLLQKSAEIYFQALVRADHFDLYFEPNFIPFLAPLPTVITVHDLSVIKYPHWHPRDRVKHHQHHFLRGCEQATHIITITESIRQELIHDLHLAPERVSTIHNGVGPQYYRRSETEILSLRQKYQLPPDYYLAVGTIEPRKNLGMLMQAYAELPSTLQAKHPLVLVGAWGWCSQQERSIYEKLVPHHNIRLIGYVSAQELPALYSGAWALLYPSHYEGFGLPPVEMAQCGGLALCSTDRAVREVVGTTGRFLEATDQQSWSQELLRISQDLDYYQMLRAGHQQVAGRYSWQHTAQQVHALFQRIITATPADTGHK